MRVRTKPLLAASLSCLAVTIGACADDGGGGDDASAMTMTMTGAGTVADDGDDGSADDGDDTPDDGDDTPDDGDDGADSTAGDDVGDDTPDDGGSDDVSDTGEPGDVQAFRFTSLYVRDPHFFANSVIGCVDVTDMVPLMPGASVNEQFNAAINGDDPDMPDGNLDLSLLMLFRPLDQADGAAGMADFANGTCLIPAAATVCDLLPDTELNPAAYTSQAAGVCHMPDAAHLSSEGYQPAPGMTSGPCFHAGPADVRIVTTSFDLPLDDAEIAGTFNGDPATEFMTGTLRGFLSVASATATVLPADLQKSTGAMTVADLLAGSANGCADHSDLDGEGWWFYADFTATQVPWEGE